MSVFDVPDVSDIFGRFSLIVFMFFAVLDVAEPQFFGSLNFRNVVIGVFANTPHCLHVFQHWDLHSVNIACMLVARAFQMKH